MIKNVTQKLIESHIVEGKMALGETVAIRIDHTLTQDATGTMVMLEFEAMDVPKVKTELSAQYVDHNILQVDYKNADDHLFLQSSCQKFGAWYSAPGNGVSHPVHMERFGIPGKTILGSDSHTPAAGSLGMLAIGAGGLEVAMAMAGEPFHLKVPKVWGVKLVGKLNDWVSAKDVILEMLRRHNVDGGVGKIIEYYGPGLEHLSAMDRHVIANMGAELGATTTVFPSDGEVKRFLKSQGRESDWVEIVADEGCDYDEHETIDLSEIVPLIACPSSPGNVVPVSEVAGREIYQSYVGSSANPGLRDFAIAAMIVKGKTIHPNVSFDINPSSRQVLENLLKMGHIGDFIACGARLHQAGCNGCIGMGQAPATGRNSLRTTPRNFPGRSGTKEDSVYLCSPETAAASALTGVITDPRTLDQPYPKYEEPAELVVNNDNLLAPPTNGEAIEIQKGPNVRPLPVFDKMWEAVESPVLLKLADDVSTDEIMPAGAKVLPYRSNVPEISKFTFAQVDEKFYDCAMECRDIGSIIVGGNNYGQGSSREHAAIGPRFLGVKVVIAKSFARIHWRNLINFGILPLTFENPADWNQISQGDVLKIENLREAVSNSDRVEVVNVRNNHKFIGTFTITERHREMLLAGSLINVIKHKN